MKITIWTVACDDDKGTYARVFSTEQQAIDWLWKNAVKPNLDGDTLKAAKRRTKNDIYEAIDHYCTLWPPVSYNHERHEIDTLK